MNLKMIAYSAIALLILSGCNPSSPEIDFTPHSFADTATYSNPVIRGFFPDPSVCRAGTDYYLVTSSFEYFPGVPILHSTDLVNWEHIGNVLDRESQLPLHGQPSSGGIFAPTIRYHDGTFYMITTNIEGGRNFFVTATDPAGPWSEPVFIPSQNIDPSLFFDDDGKVYYTGTSPWDGSGPGIYQAEIDIETGELLNDYRLIWEGTGGRYAEGPHLYKLDGWYYLMISEGGTETGHYVTIARSRDPYGPFEECPHNPILTNRNEPYSNPVQNSGHADLVQAPDGKWWMVHLAVRNINKHHHLGRETFLLPVEWDADGWPVVNRDGVSYIDMHAVPPAPQHLEQPSRTYDFTEPMGPEWIHLRNPVTEHYRLDTVAGHLEIRGGRVTLDQLASPSFTGFRQQHFGMEYTCELTAGLPREGDNAGIAVYMNNEHYYTLTRRREGNREVISLEMKLGRINHTAARVPATAERIFLKVGANREMYRFYWSEDATDWKYLGENYARLLSTETAGGFTGVILGLYVAAGETGKAGTAGTSGSNELLPTGRFHSVDYRVK